MNPVVVIGAGPYGLATAAHLRAQGLPVRIFGDPLATWRKNMPTGMILKSVPRASSISAPKPGYTLQDFCDEAGIERLDADHQVVPNDTFVRYGTWFQERVLPDLEQSRVVSVDRHDGAFTVRLDSGEELRAQAVVVATGFMHFTYVPDELRAAAPDGISAAGPVSHSSQHVDLARFSGREVLIVGAGQSALEGAALLHEAGADVKVVVRGRAARFGTPPTSPPHWQPWSPLGRSWSLYAFSRHGERFRYLPVATRMYLVRNVLGPSGGWWLRYRVDGQVPILTGRRVVRGRVEDGRPVLTLTGSDGGTTEVSADHVMAATGYRVDVDALDFLAPALRASLARTARAPRLDTGFQSSVPGLYFTGFAAAATFGPVMRFVCGTVTAAPRLATRVAAAHP